MSRLVSNARCVVEQQCVRYMYVDLFCSFCFANISVITARGAKLVYNSTVVLNVILVLDSGLVDCVSSFSNE